MTESLVHACLAGISAGMFIWLVASGLTLIFWRVTGTEFRSRQFLHAGSLPVLHLPQISGVDFWLGVIVGPLAVCAVGYLMERLLLRRVYDLDLPYQLLLTFALVLIFDELVKIILGAGSIGSPSVPGLSGSVQIAGRNFPVYNLFIMVVGPLVALGLWIFLKRVGWGGLFERPLRIVKWPLPLG